MTLSELRRRVAEAKGSDRELDCALVKLAFGVNACPTAFAERDWEFYTDDEPIQTVPRYTASVDAALALVERLKPGWKRQFWDAGVYGAKRPTASLFEPGFVKKSRAHKPFLEFRGQGATPGLALLAALLFSLPDEGRVG